MTCTSGRGSLRARVCCRRRCSFCLKATASAIDCVDRSAASRAPLVPLRCHAGPRERQRRLASQLEGRGSRRPIQETPIRQKREPRAASPPRARACGCKAVARCAESPGEPTVAGPRGRARPSRRSARRRRTGRASARSRGDEDACTRAEVADLRARIQRAWRRGRDLQRKLRSLK
jgi:hypothetical protein